MKRLLLAVVLVVAGTVFAQAQGTVCESNCAVAVGQPFVAFTEQLAGSQGYVLTVDGLTSPVAYVVANGLVEFSHPGFTSAGAHTLVIYVQTAQGLIQLTDPLPLSAVRGKIKIRK